jgi:hypothetical protein
LDLFLLRCFGLWDSLIHTGKKVLRRIEGRFSTTTVNDDPVCGYCGHRFSVHNRNVRDDRRTASVDEALLPLRRYDINTNKPAGQSGCSVFLPRVETLTRYIPARPSILSRISSAIEIDCGGAPSQIESVPKPTLTRGRLFVFGIGDGLSRATPPPLGRAGSEDRRQHKLGEAEKIAPAASLFVILAQFTANRRQGPE